MKRFYLLISLLLISILVLPALAQNDDEQQEASLIFTGTVVIIDENTVEVGGLTVDVSDFTDIVFVNGMEITVSGNLEGLIVIPVIIDTVDDAPEATEAPEATPDPEATPEATPDAEATPEVVDYNGITIVIAGPVQSINVNIITIYSFEIELPENDPRITVIQVGDVIEVRGYYDRGRTSHRGSRNLFAIVAIAFIFVDVDVILIDGLVWRDYGDCAIVPPDWADGLAIHWHTRCDVIIINVGPGVPAGCKVTGMGGVKCSNRGSGMKGS